MVKHAERAEKVLDFLLTASRPYAPSQISGKLGLDVRRVREALHALEGIGAVISRPYYGACGYVSPYCGKVHGADAAKFLCRVLRKYHKYH
ncbi:hypothetical protein ACJU26_08925 [Acidithiobacillus sp. M4-SHS-6]|uniref:hypothetical protein n=1 Tax=Acidithiobacillus sp. M4-SHS-6 TaxID=3383024 RepID=UPI0039BE6036